jgi:hypothetical protein
VVFGFHKLYTIFLPPCHLPQILSYHVVGFDQINFCNSFFEGRSTFLFVKFERREAHFLQSANLEDLVIGA